VNKALFKWPSAIYACLAPTWVLAHFSVSEWLGVKHVSSAFADVPRSCESSKQLAPQPSTEAHMYRAAMKDVVHCCVPRPTHDRQLPLRIVGRFYQRLTVSPGLQLTPWA